MSKRVIPGPQVRYIDRRNARDDRVVELTRQGRTQKEIAVALDVSVRSVFRMLARANERKQGRIL